MKKRVFLICLAVLVCLSGIGVRIWYVNKDRRDWVEKVYPMGEMVPYEDDYFEQSLEIRDSYELGVMSARIMTAEDYVKEHGVTTEEVWGEYDEMPKFIIDIEVKIRNNATEENDQYIDSIRTHLFAGGDEFMRSKELLDCIYPQLAAGTFGFRVRPGTEATLHIPFSVLQWQPTSIERIKSQDLYLVLSAYPTKKMIKIELE